MPIDLAAVNWLYVAILSVFAFIAALLGSYIAFRNRVVGAIIAGILFAAAYVFWTYYPHPEIPGPISPGAIAAESTAPARAEPAPAAAMRPANPVTTLTPAPAPAAPAPAAPATPAPSGTK